MLERLYVICSTAAFRLSAFASNVLSYDSRARVKSLYKSVCIPVRAEI